MKKVPRKILRYIVISVFFTALSLFCIPTQQVKAVNIDSIKQQVRNVVEQRQNQENASTSTEGAQKNNSSRSAQGKTTSPPKKTKPPVIKVLGTWWNGKITLESRDGLWVLVFS